VGEAETGQTAPAVCPVFSFFPGQGEKYPESASFRCIGGKMSVNPRQMFGRTVIYSSVEKVTAANVVPILTAVLPIHERNKADIEFLYGYWKGNQPILSRTKTVRPEICNKIVENHALEIVSFKKAYVFGEPVQYVRHGGEESLSEKINLLNEMMLNSDKGSFDSELAEWMFICGTAYRMVLPDRETAFQIDCLDPRETFVVYNTGFGRKPLMSVQCIQIGDTTLHAIYTPETYFEVTEGKLTKEQTNTLGMIPVIEYAENTARLGSFEPVLGLLDAINNSASNRMDGVEQFVQAFLKFVNCDIDETKFQALKDLGAIKIRSVNGLNADVELVNSEFNQTQAQIQADHIYQMVLIICGMPDRNGSNRTTGDTGQAVILRDGWTAAEARARDTETMFKKAEKKFLALVLKILRDSGNLDLGLTDIEIKFTRNKSDSLLVKTQGLQNMLEAGIHPELAIKISNLFSDPQQAYLSSVPYLEKWKMLPVAVTPGNNKPDPEDGDSEEGDSG
jgi:SPP1 family phage portal protein